MHTYKHAYPYYKGRPSLHRRTFNDAAGSCAVLGLVASLLGFVASRNLHCNIMLLATNSAYIPHGAQEGNLLFAWADSAIECRDNPSTLHASHMRFDATSDTLRKNAHVA